MTLKFGPDVVDRAWNHFNGGELGRWDRSYKQKHRSDARCQRFEDWLWEHGGMIVQIDRVRYLVFGVPRNATMFLMKLK